MSVTETRLAAGAPLVVRPGTYVQWSAVIAGSIAAAALAFVLHSFAAAIGLAVSSTAPTWRDASVALWLLSGLYLIVVALAAYGLGGYIAGRMRPPFPGALADEVEAHDRRPWPADVGPGDPDHRCADRDAGPGGAAAGRAIRRPGRPGDLGRRRKYHRLRPGSAVPLRPQARRRRHELRPRRSRAHPVDGLEPQRRRERRSRLPGSPGCRGAPGSRRPMRNGASIRRSRARGTISHAPAAAP